MIAAVPPVAAGVAKASIVAAPGILSAMAVAIQTLYGIADEFNQYLDKHIEEMKLSQNPTVSRSGRVLEMAKFGFGVGFITPIVVIAVGQLLLGNPLAAITTVVTAPANPIAMTCAAIGAIYYGWGALSDKEREEILDRLSTGLEVGIEFIRSVVRFVIDKTKDVLSSKNIEEFKKYIQEAAAEFGKTVADVTRKFSDRVQETVDVIVKKSGEVAEKTGTALSDAYSAVVDTATAGAKRTGEALTRSGPKKRAKAKAEIATEATLEVAPSAQRKHVATVKAAAGKPDVAPKAKRKPVAKVKVEIAAKSKAETVPRVKLKPAPPRSPGKPKLA